MRQGRRYGLSAEQKAEIWDRWKAGESLHEIGRAFGKDHGSIQFLLSQAAWFSLWGNVYRLRNWPIGFFHCNARTDTFGYSRES